MRELFSNENFFNQISRLYQENHSLQKTAKQMGVAYGKVRKILITIGEYQTAFSRQVEELKKKGFSVSEIANDVGSSEKRVTAFLPYEKRIYDAPISTNDAKKCRNYRKRIEVATENIVTKMYPPMGEQLLDKKKEREMEKNIMIENSNIYPVRLHLELQNEWCDDEDKHLLMKYAEVAEQGTITRDILIPSDMPLHNLHYAIQRLFGWQNSHLRCFRIEENDYQRLTGGMVKGWAHLVGTLFQGLPEDENDVFWDDHYTGGSFKIWLKKKYTGPYHYSGYVETYLMAKKSIHELVKRFPEIEVKESFEAYYARTKKMAGRNKVPIRVLKRAPLMELTLEELNNSIMIEEGTDKLLERLEVISVLASPEDKTVDSKVLGNRLVNPIYEGNNGTISGMEEPEVFPVTHKLLYNYDYGDNWVVEITRKNESNDLLKAGLLSEVELKLAMQQVIEKHKPVCISKKGGYVVDDVGGMHGYADFIRTIYQSDDKEERKKNREWAEGLGWSSRNILLGKML